MAASFVELGPRYPAAYAESLFRKAWEVVHQAPGKRNRAVLMGRRAAVGKGLFNRNVPVSDPVHGITVNVRIPEQFMFREPVAWRGSLRETEISEAQRRAGLRNRPTTYYASPDGRFQIQKHEPDITPWMSGGRGPVSEHQVHELARTWAETLELDLPHRAGLLPIDMISMQANHLPTSHVVTRIPHDFDAYRDLQVAQTQAALAWHQSHWGEALDDLGLAMAPQDYATRARRTLDQVVPVRLAPTHPDRHRGNLGMRDGRLFEWDPELIGFHDPRHAVAVAVQWEDYGGQEPRVIQAHERVSPRFLRGGFTEGVDAWRDFTDVDQAARRVPRVFWHLARSESVEQVEKAVPLWAPYVAQLVNNAAPHVGITQEVSPERVAAVLAQTTYPLVRARTETQLATAGMAPAAGLLDPALRAGSTHRSPLSIAVLAETVTLARAPSPAPKTGTALGQEMGKSR